MGWWFGLAPDTPEFWVRFPNERNQGKHKGEPCVLQVPGSSRVPVPFSPRGRLSEFEEQSRTRGGQRGGAEDQPQHRRLWRRRTPNARSLSRSPSS
jgi:hypothetical protein